MNNIDADVWLSYIENEIGFVLPKTQHRWLSNAVVATAKKHNMTAQQLWLAIQHDYKLRQQLFDAVLILESRFFRHLPSLKYVTKLATEYVTSHSSLASKPNAHLSSTSTNTSLNSNRFGFKQNVEQYVQPFKIWSVGCAKGQEVWSLVMMLDNHHLTNYQVLGTDVSQQAIKQAKAARYTTRECASIPYTYKQYLQDEATQMTTAMSERWQVVERLKKQVTFTYHNIFTSVMPTATLQNVIICQNVLIYFRQFDQRDILSRLVSQCQVGGHILLAPGEALFWHHPKMQRVSHPEVNAWLKIKA